jgi:hypothetical protein
MKRANAPGVITTLGFSTRRSTVALRETILAFPQLNPPIPLRICLLEHNGKEDDSEEKKGYGTNCNMKIMYLLAK